MRTKPSKELLERLYVTERISPEDIGKRFGYSGRSVREWLAYFEIPRLGPSHLRTGKSAVWNVGLTRTETTKKKISLSKIGRPAPNKDKGRVNFNCHVCGNCVFDKPYRRKYTCSERCKNKRMSLVQGEGHWNYKGEEAGFRQRTRNWAIYRKWRKAVFERDGFACAKCGSAGCRLTAHHLNSFSAHPEERFDTNNGATLCWPCHWAFHKENGHKFSTKEQFLAWVTKS